LTFSNNILIFNQFRNIILIPMITHPVYQIPETSKDSIVVLGSGFKNLLIISDKDRCGETERTTLSKMIGAIKYTFPDDVFWVELSKDEAILASVIMPSYKDVLLFGVSPERAGFNIESKHYHIAQFEQRRLLYCDHLQEIVTNVQKKQMLWTKLQEMFLKP